MGERPKHTDTELKDENRTSTIMIYEACVDLHNQGQTVNREALQIALPNLTRGKIDDRLKYLVDTHQLHRVDRGVYIPLFKHRPARLISKMTLPDGTVKIEIGDDQVLTLTPKEARDLGLSMVGEAMMLSNIEQGRAISHMTNHLTSQISKLSHSIEKINERQIHAGLSAQTDLFEESGG